MFSCGKYGGSASTVIDPPKKTMQDVAWSRPFTQQASSYTDSVGVSSSLTRNIQ